MTTVRSRISTAAKNPVVPWALFGAALVAAVAFGVLLKIKADEISREDSEQDAVRRQATEFIVTLTNVTFETIDSDVAELKEMATGQLRDEIDQLFSDENTTAIKEAEVQLHGEIDEVFIESLGDETAKVFVVVSLDVSNRDSDAPVPGIARMELGLRLTSATWKADMLELLQSPDQPNLFPSP
jgi:hypothetical protein